MKRPGSAPANDQDDYMSAERALPTIREAVAACYHLRLNMLNGGPWYQNEQYSIRMEVSPGAIACAIQNNIEGALIAEYGPEQGAINSADMLSAMLIDDMSAFTETRGLSELGVSVMDELFKSLAEMAHESLSQGKPITAAMNQSIH